MSDESSSNSGCGCLPFIVLILVFVAWSASNTAEHDRAETQRLRERVTQLEHRP